MASTSNVRLDSVPPETATNDDLNGQKLSIDLVGGPFAVIESDPGEPFSSISSILTHVYAGVFTTLTRKLGVKHLEIVELYDIEPWAVDHLHPYGLVFCFRWRKDTHRPAEFKDPAAEHVWFANQLSDDACASQAILNILFNCSNVNIGKDLSDFKEYTREMSPEMKGLAISNSSLIRNAHNSLARPADLRGADSALATTILDSVKKEKEKTNRGSNPPPNKRAKTKNPPTKNPEQGDEETYHFIGYVPAYCKVWELDGLKSGPLEVGDVTEKTEWMDVVRPALRMKMRKYGGGGDDGGNDIRFSLLAIVDDAYEKASDEWEYCKSERRQLERRLEEGWQKAVSCRLYSYHVDPSLLSAASNVFDGGGGQKFASDFASRRNDRDRDILYMDQDALRHAWEQCVNNAMKAKVAVGEEMAKAWRDHTDHVKRIHDYEPFFVKYLKFLKDEGLLSGLLAKK
ncbi:cysteine proteinase [Guyanagaster necrorhizus]|uniref:ubiquitinyl hydrolase 1 n=1 Tax=Guyanagaster necrorhizus TaxID=856835 RepID=A0A9P7VLL3_9AGAR|nr:cysteine proteinase [Guyanagaster necrorhizus MCA 3950]KAG7442154.1 cysteine proteinase [Guyanagaster necrorhizus MCA 3950]